MIKAYRSYWKNGLNFYDRTSVSGYWWVALVNVSAFILLFVFMYLSTRGAIAGFLNPFTFVEPVAAVVFLVIWPLINAIPSLAMTIRRLHDTGRSVAYYLFALIPVAGMIIMIYFLTSPTKPLQESRYGCRRQV